MILSIFVVSSSSVVIFGDLWRMLQLSLPGCNTSRWSLSPVHSSALVPMQTQQVFVYLTH